MSGPEFDNVYVCYTTQNFLKALYLSHRSFERGETSLILALFLRGRFHPLLSHANAIEWADVKLVEHTHEYVRILARDRRWWPVLAAKLSRKLLGRVRRLLSRRADRRRVMAEVNRARRVFLFIERTYFSSLILRERTCTLVEEGCSTYLPYRGSVSLDHPSDVRYPGEHARISEVWLQRPEHAHERVRPKVTRFELSYRALPVRSRERIATLFPLELPHSIDSRSLIVGQAWSWSSIGVERAIALYRTIISELRARGHAVFIKPHPSEPRAAYLSLDAHVLDPRIPLEAFELCAAPYPFEYAISVLSSSVADTHHLARRVVCFLEGELTVEVLSDADFASVEREAKWRVPEWLDVEGSLSGVETTLRASDRDARA